MNLEDYHTLIFDCDGVVLNSNRVKTEAFRQAALAYGADAADALVSWHVANGGISRYRKFEHFLKNIVPKGTPGPNIDTLLARYAAIVRDGLMSCDAAPGLHALRVRTKSARWLIASGGDQAELRDVFQARRLADLFDGGIFGSPDTKETILDREMQSGNIRQPAVFFGDSTYDHHVAHGAGICFVFVSAWSEVKGWAEYVRNHKLHSIDNLHSFLY